MGKKYSEKLEEFIKANVPQSEKISVAEILEKAAEYNLEVIDHISFYVIRSSGEKDTGLVLSKDAAGPKGFVKIIYSAEDVWINTAGDYMQYNPHFGKGAVIFRELRNIDNGFWGFSQDVLFGRTKKVILPESLCYLNVGSGQSIEVFSSEAGEYLERLKALEKQKKEEEERRKLAPSSTHGTIVM